MVERVARAICEMDGYDPDGWFQNEDLVRVVFAAMREPTDVELLAGYNVISRLPLDDAGKLIFGTTKEIAPFKMKTRWQAMIDAALSESPAPDTKDIG